MVEKRKVGSWANAESAKFQFFRQWANDEWVRNRFFEQWSNDRAVKKRFFRHWSNDHEVKNRFFGHWSNDHEVKNRFFERWANDRARRNENFATRNSLHSAHGKAAHLLVFPRNAVASSKIVGSSPTMTEMPRPTKMPSKIVHDKSQISQREIHFTQRTEKRRTCLLFLRNAVKSSKIVGSSATMTENRARQNAAENRGRPIENFATQNFPHSAHDKSQISQREIHLICRKVAAKLQTENCDACFEILRRKKNR